jgi:hypothetical protein
MRDVLGVLYPLAVLVGTICCGWVATEVVFPYERPPHTHQGYMRWLMSEQREVVAKRTRRRRSIAMAVVVPLALVAAGAAWWWVGPSWRAR